MAVNPQNQVIPPSFHYAVDPGTGAMANVRSFGAQSTSHCGINTTLNITSPTVVKASAGRTVRLSVTVAGSSAGTLNDCTTTGAAAAANAVAAIPNAVGIYYFDWPHSTGIVVVPGSGQAVAINWD